MSPWNALFARAAILAQTALPLVGVADRERVDAKARLEAAMRVGPSAPFRTMAPRRGPHRG